MRGVCGDNTAVYSPLNSVCCLLACLLVVCVCVCSFCQRPCGAVLYHAYDQGFCVLPQGVDADSHSRIHGHRASE